jgi:hypothetical protein
MKSNYNYNASKKLFNNLMLFPKKNWRVKLGLIKFALVLITALGAAGCSTTTIMDKHERYQESYPGKSHYAVAMPFGSYTFQKENQRSNKNKLYRDACWYGDSPVYKQPARLPWKYTFGRGGGSQAQIEKYVIQECEEQNNRTCIVLLYNDYKRCEPTFEAAYAREVERVKQREENIIRIAEEAEKKKIEQYMKACEKIGFDEGSKEMSTCIFDLYKQSQSTSQSQTINQQNLDDNSGVRALLEEQKKQRQLEAALELMKQGSEMMNPPNPKLTCKYNPLTYKTVCN